MTATARIELDALPPMDHGTRLVTLRDAMARLPEPIDALVVSKAVHLRYLFGFTGSAGLGWVSGSGAMLITDSRYQLQAPRQLEAAGLTDAVDLRISRDASDELPGADRIGLEADDISWARQRDIADHWFPNADLVATTGLIETQRGVKDTGELARIEAAAAVADAALEHVVPMLGDHRHEIEIAMALDDEMRRLGSSGPAYPTIVATGHNGANPHASPGHRPIADGDLVVIDVGALVDGYRSDMTRTFSIGEPDDDAARLLAVVTAAQAAGVDAVRAGTAVADIDRACRDHIADAGLAEAFTHGTGHGVGLEIHEAPMVNARNEAILRPGHVITVEPGVYLAERGGVRVEDTVLVTETGHRTLTSTPRTVPRGRAESGR